MNVTITGLDYRYRRKIITRASVKLAMRKDVFDYMKSKAKIRSHTKLGKKVITPQSFSKHLRILCMLFVFVLSLSGTLSELLLFIFNPT